MKAFLKKLLSVSLFMLCLAVHAHAQHYRFARVESVAGLDTSANYVIASSFSAPRFLLSNKEAGGGSKLAAKITDLGGDTIEVNDVSLHWHISLRDGMYAFSSVQSGKYISKEKQGADISMGTKPLLWNVSDNGGIISCFSDEDGSLRYLSCDTVYRYFGRFKKAVYYSDLVFYKSIESSAGDDSGSLSPDENGEYCLLAEADSKYYAASVIVTGDSYMKAENVSSLMLSDGSFPLNDDNMRWRVSREESGIFKLCTKDGNGIAPQGEAEGTFYEVVAVPFEESASFFLREGLVVTQLPTGEETCLAFVSDMSDGQGGFCFAKVGEIGQNGVLPVKLSKLPAKASMTTDTYGLKTLEGGYSTDMLAKTLDDVTTSLDLRKIVLPEKLRDFDFDGVTNCIIYVNKDDIPRIPESWKNVVACGSQGANHLVRIMRIEDRKAFHAAYSFEVGEDSLYYTRSVPCNGWNTLYLPFNAVAIPDGLLVCSAANVENDVINLSSETEIEALQPYVFKCVEDGEGNMDVTFCAAAGTLPVTTVSEAGNDGLVGTLVRKEVEADDEGTYILSDDGLRFVNAAAGSYLDAFRCSFGYDSTADNRLVLRYGGLTGIHDAEFCGDNKIYDLNGVCLGEVNGNNMETLPLYKGIYIINGKKIIKTK